MIMIIIVTIFSSDYYVLGTWLCLVLTVPLFNHVSFVALEFIK